MARKSVAEMMTLIQIGANVKVSARDYTASELVTMSQYIGRDMFFIIRDVADMPTSSLSTTIRQCKGKVILDCS